MADGRKVLAHIVIYEVDAIQTDSSRITSYELECAASNLPKLNLVEVLKDFIQEVEEDLQG